jgi:hypothetical protein
MPSSGLCSEYHKLKSFQPIGISHHVSYSYVHQQNSSVERKHRHIVEVGLTLLAQASMSFVKVILTLLSTLQQEQSVMVHY